MKPTLQQREENTSKINHVFRFIFGTTCKTGETVPYKITCRFYPRNCARTRLFNSAKKGITYFFAFHNSELRCSQTNRQTAVKTEPRPEMTEAKMANDA